MSLWDAIGQSVNDGIGELIDMGVDRAAKELNVTSATEVSQQPKTTPITEDVGRNANGTTVTKAVEPPPSVPVAPQWIPGVSNARVMLAGGAVTVLLFMWVMERRR